MGEPPRLTSRTASNNSDVLVRFSRYPLAPAASELKMFSVSSYAVSIITWVSGRSCFSCRTHSTPLRPGRLISINTTSGLSFGRASSAASAVACWPRQRKPSARLSTRASVPRNWSLSSTMETVIAMVASAFSERRRQTNQRAAFGGRAERKSAADILQPFAHVAQSISSDFVTPGGKTATVILDFQGETVGSQLQSHLGGGGLGMLHNVVYRL